MTTVQCRDRLCPLSTRLQPPTYLRGSDPAELARAWWWAAIGAASWGSSLDDKCARAPKGPACTGCLSSLGSSWQDLEAWGVNLTPGACCAAMPACGGRA